MPSFHPLSEDPSDFEDEEVMEDEDREPDEDPPVDYDKVDDFFENRAEQYFHGDE